MSLYKNAVSNLVTAPPRGYVRIPKTAAIQIAAPMPGKPIVHLVKVAKVIKTPHGTVVSGELLHAQYVPPHVGGFDIGHDEIGFFKKLRRGIKKAAKGVGRGIKKGAKGVGKGVKKGAKGGFRVVKKTGKVVVRGPRGALKWVARNPIKALAAVASAPLGVTAFVAHKAIKKIGGKKKRGGSPRALSPVAASDETATQSPGGVPDGSESQDGGQESASGPESEGAEGDSYGSQKGGKAAVDEANASMPADDASESNDSPAEDAGDEQQQSDAAESEGDESSEGEEAPEEDAGSADNEVSGMPNEEWVGLDEIAGDEWVGDEDVGADDVGAARRPAPKKGPNAALIRKVGYTKKRRQPLPLGSVGTVGAGASATVTVIPQTLFRGRRIVIPTALAPNFTIEDIKIGNISQTAASGSIPGEAFAPTSTGDDNIQMDTCPPGMSISLSVTNTSAGPLQFRAVIFGDSVQ